MQQVLHYFGELVLDTQNRRRVRVSFVTFGCRTAARGIPSAFHQGHSRQLDARNCASDRCYIRRVNPIPASANPTLVGIFTQHLLSEFGGMGHPALPSPAYFDPSWWPIDLANLPEHWGLQPSEQDASESLCDIPRKGKSYPGFRCSLGASPGRGVLLGEGAQIRPTEQDACWRPARS